MFLIGLCAAFGASVLFNVGVALQALEHVPFVVVQPALCAGLLLLLALGVHMLGERVGPAEIAGVVAIMAGMTLVAWGAPADTEATRGLGAVAIVMTALCAFAATPLALRGGRLDLAMLVVVSSGIGFGATNIAAKLAIDDLDAGALGLCQRTGAGTVPVPLTTGAGTRRGGLVT